MLLSNVIAIQYQDIQDVDGADFSLGFPLGRVIRRLATQTVAISALIYSLLFDRTSFSSNKKAPFQILEAHKHTCHPPGTGVCRLHSSVSGQGRTTAAITSSLCVIRCHSTKASALQHTHLQSQRTGKLPGSNTLRCDYTTRTFSPRSAITAEHLCTQRAIEHMKSSW